MRERPHRCAPLVATLATVLLPTVGCGEEPLVPATQLLVSVNSDLDVDSQLSSVEVALQDFEGKGPLVDTRSFSVTSETPLEGQTRLPFSFGIGRGKEERLRLIVRGFAPARGGGQRLVVQHTLICGFQERQTLLVKVFLGSACYEQLCAEDGAVEATCYAHAEGETGAGECGPIPVLTGLEPLATDADPHAWTRFDAGASEPDSTQDMDARARDDAAVEAGPLAEAAVDARPIEASLPEAAAPMPRTLSVSVLGDADDVTWVTEADTVAPYAVRTTERFHYRTNTPSGRHIEVGNDEADETIGLRFVLPIERGATINSARLTLQRFAMVSPEYPNVAPESATMRVQVFDSAAVAPFVATHEHGPVDHAPLWLTSVNGFRAGALGQDTQSPELAQLVQHVVDRAEWKSGSSVVFVLSVDAFATGNYADFTDYAADPARAARLQLTYTPAAPP